jgi:L-fuconolactonase
MRIDAHQHFWKFNPVRDSWITDEMAVIKKDFFPSDLKTILQQNDFEGSVVVQCDQSETENEFLLNAANEYDFIKGIVGWVNLQSPDVEERLAYYHSFEKMKGFRHVLQSETDRQLMLKEAFMNGISELQQFDFTYDILIYADQLKYIPKFVAAFPEQKFVMDHIGKPEIKDKKIEEWKKDIMQIAKYENVYCKISGMVTEADWKNWHRDDFIPYIETVLDAFGIERVMYGSDWPVCLVAASYEDTLNIVQQYFSSLSKSEQEMFFGKNAIEFYNL